MPINSADKIHERAREYRFTNRAKQHRENILENGIHIRIPVPEDTGNHNRSAMDRYVWLQCIPRTDWFLDNKLDKHGKNTMYYLHADHREVAMLFKLTFG